MSLSDCIKCWDTPCCCGWDTLPGGKEGLQRQINKLQEGLNKLYHNWTAPFLNYTERTCKSCGKVVTYKDSETEWYSLCPALNLEDLGR